MIFVAHLGAYCAHTHPIDHFAGMTVVPTKNKNQQMSTKSQQARPGKPLPKRKELFLPMLVHEFFLSDGESTEFIAKRIFILQR